MLTMFRSLYMSLNWPRVSCLIIGSVYLYAGLAKALDVQGFTKAIMEYQMTGLIISGILASTLPYIEILAGVFLIFGYKEKEALIIIMALSLMFTFAIWYAVLTGLSISCGCFASDQPTNLTYSLVRNLLIISACLYSLTRKGWIYDPQSKSVNIA